MKRAIAAAAAFATTLALLAGQVAPAASPPAQASRARTVGINHFAYHPHELELRKGAQVVFHNASNVTHTATGAGFNSGRIKPGGSFTVRFTHKGTFAYHCEIHPFMHGKIIVH
jgi:plastocyanin